MQSDIYRENAAALSKYYPKIMDIISKYDPYDDNDKDALTVETQQMDDRFVLAASIDGKMYQLNSMYNDNTLLDMWFRSLGEWGLNGKIFMYGLGTGMFASYFLKHARKDCRAYIYVPSFKIFSETVKNYDITDIIYDNRMILIFGELYNDIQLRSIFESAISYKDFSTVKYYQYPNYPVLFVSDFERYKNVLSSAVNFVQANQNVQNKFGKLNNENFFHNVIEYLPSSYNLCDLKGIAIKEDVPAIIVAAGPSLDKNMMELVKAKGKAIIIAADTSVRPLCNAGIIPDIMVTADGEKDKRYLSAEKSPEIPLIARLKSGKSFMDAHKGKKFLFSEVSSRYTKILSGIGVQMPIIQAGGSVANTCFSVADYFGCRTIIMIGQDLAYTDAHTHSADTVRGEVHTKEENLQNVVWGKDINGNPIRTSLEFTIYKEWFEEQIEAKRDLNVIDATEGGIYINGTSLETLTDAIKKYCIHDFDFSKILDRACKLINEEQKNLLNEYYDSLRGELDKVDAIIQETLGYYMKMHKIVKNNNYHSKEMARLYRKCQDNTAKIDNNGVMEYLNYQLQCRQTELLMNVNNIVSDEKEELLTTCEIGIKYLNDLKDSVGELRTIIA